MKRKILGISLIAALLAIAVVGGTLAYFTDTDEKVNTFTVGNISIELIEQQYDNGNLVDYVDKKLIMPGETTDKIISVENTGNNDAWVRVSLIVATDMTNALSITFPNADADKFVEAPAVVDGENTIYTYYYNEVLGAEATSGLLEAKVGLVASFDWVTDAEGNVTAYTYIKDGVRYNVPVAGIEAFDPEIKVVAEAIQTAASFAGYEDAFKAYGEQAAVTLAPVEETETVDE